MKRGLAVAMVIVVLAAGRAEAVRVKGSARAMRTSAGAARVVDPRARATRWRGPAERLKRRLAARAERAYEAGDVRGLKRVYEVLALGGRLRGYRLASGNLRHFLHGKGEARRIASGPIRRDPAVRAAMKGLRAEMLAAARARAGAEGRFAVESRRVVVKAERADVYYALGSFHLSARAEVEVVRGAEGRRRLRTVVRWRMDDRYDWHPDEGTAADPVGVPGLFRDRWGAMLVERGEAHDFDVHAEWSERGYSS